MDTIPFVEFHRRRPDVSSGIAIRLANTFGLRFDYAGTDDGPARQNLTVEEAQDLAARCPGALMLTYTPPVFGPRWAAPERLDDGLWNAQLVGHPIYVAWTRFGAPVVYVVDGGTPARVISATGADNIGAAIKHAEDLADKP